MRLIDADELLRRFNDRSIEFNANINDVILEQPTAYDLDEVCEELEKYGDKFSSENYDDWYAASVVSDCEEIVKRGGIDAK